MSIHFNVDMGLNMKHKFLEDLIYPVFLFTASGIVLLAMLTLAKNTSPDINAEIKVPYAENVRVVCDLGTETIMEFPATVVWREGDTLHIKHPRSSFVLQDPNNNCTIKQ